MEIALKALPATLLAFGPAGTVLIILVGVMAYFYRRDFKRDVAALREAHDRRDLRETRDIEAKEKIAVAITGMSQAIREGDERCAAMIDSVIRGLRA